MLRNLVRSLRFWLAPAALWMASVAPAGAQEMFAGWGAACGLDCGTCAVGCQTHHCPPPLSHCQERPPVIRVKCGCPKPICNPCTQPGWGYYETCWSPWPFPPNYNHCNTLPPAATVALTGPNNPTAPYYGPGGQGGQGNVGVPTAPNRQPPLPVEPNVPQINTPPIPTTPVMPRLGGNSQPTPNFQPMPGGGIDSLPVPRPDTPRPDSPRPEIPPRPLPNPGGAY